MRQECVFLLRCKDSHLILDPLNGPADNTDLYCPALQGVQHNRVSQADIDLNGYHASELLLLLLFFLILDQDVDSIQIVLSIVASFYRLHDIFNPSIHLAINNNVNVAIYP